MIESSGVERTRRPVQDLSADALERELVGDFAAGVHTPLARFLPALLKIAEARRCSAEDVYQEIRGQALALGAPRSHIF